MNEQKRFAGDIDAAFGSRIEPCSICGSSFRFELEAHALAECEADFAAAVTVVSWRYKLATIETIRFFDALSGFRLQQ